MCKEESIVYLGTTSSFSWSKAKIWLISVERSWWDSESAEGQKIEWIELAVRSALFFFWIQPCVALLMYNCVRKQLRVRENLLPGQLPVTLPHASRHVSAAQQGTLAKMSIFLLLFLPYKKQIPFFFHKSSSFWWGGKRSVKSFHSRKKPPEVGCKDLYPFVQQRSLVLLVCVYACVYVSECTCELFCKFMRIFVKAKVGLPACCYKIGSVYQDEETWDGGGQREEVWQELR